MTTEFYEDTDISAYYACLGLGARDGIFRLFPAPGGGYEPWEYLRCGSEVWDSIHRRIFRNYRAEPISVEQLPPGVLPLPDMPEHSEAAATAVPPQHSVADYPAIARWFAETAPGPRTVYAVLQEDEYETRFGDGEFHYLHDVFLDSDSMRTFLDHPGPGAYLYHVRKPRFALEGEVLRCLSLDQRPHDRHTEDGVLKTLESRLRERRKRA